jgi:hypothetical protein
MSILEPLTNKICGISSKSSKLNNLYKQYCHQRSQIEVQGEAFNQHLDNLKTMIVYNSSLLIIASHIKMNDANYGKWLQDTKPFTLGKPNTSEVAEVFAFVADTTAGILVGKVVKNLASSLKNKFFSNAADEAGEDAGSAIEDVGESLAEGATDALESGLSNVGEEAAESLGENVTEAAIEGATAGSLGAAAIGGAIVLALGVDAIVSTIESEKEAAALTKQTKKLQSALDQVNTYLDALNKKLSTVNTLIIKQEKQFISTMNLLNKIQTSKTFYNFDPTLKNTSKFLASMHDAAGQYFYLQSIKTNWTRMTENMPTLTWDMFVMIMDAQRPSQLTKDEVTGFLNYASQFSNSMKNAKTGKSKLALSGN